MDEDKRNMFKFIIKSIFCRTKWFFCPDCQKKSLLSAECNGIGYCDLHWGEIISKKRVDNNEYKVKKFIIWRY